MVLGISSWRTGWVYEKMWSWARKLTLHVPLIAELKIGRKIRWKVISIWKEKWRKLGYPSESNLCSSRCIRNNTKKIKAAVEWYSDWDKNSGIAENYHLILCAKILENFVEVWVLLLTQNLKKFNHLSRISSVCNFKIIIMMMIIIIVKIMIIIKIITIAAH